MTRRSLTVGALGLFVAMIAAVSAGAGADETRQGSAGGAPFLLVEPRGGNYARDGRTVALMLGFRRRTPERLTIYVPHDFAKSLPTLPGSPLGSAMVNTSRSGRPATLLRGAIAVASFDAGIAEAGRACSGRDPTGAWALTLQRGSGLIEVPVYVVSGGEGVPLRLDVCLDSLARVEVLRLELTAIRTPSRHGSYVWRAVVADSPPVGMPSPSYELRARVPVPHRLELAGRYLAKAGVAELRGSLRASGRARAGVDVAIIRLDRTVTETGFIARDRAVAIVRTSGRGRYVVRVPLRRTMGFLAYALPIEARCANGGSPPVCLTTTTAGVESEPVTVGVP